MPHCPTPFATISAGQVNDILEQPCSSENLSKLGAALDATSTQKRFARSQIYRIISKLHRRCEALKIARCFVGGSFGRRTCMYDIDVDILVFLTDKYPPFGSRNGVLETLHSGLSVSDYSVEDRVVITPHIETKHDGLPYRGLNSTQLSTTASFNNMSPTTTHTPTLPPCIFNNMSPTTTHTPTLPPCIDNISTPTLITSSLPPTTTQSDDNPINLIPFTEGDEVIFGTVNDIFGTVNNISFRIYAAPCLSLSTDQQYTESLRCMSDMMLHSNDEISNNVILWSPSLMEIGSEAISSEARTVRNLIRVCRYWQHSHNISLPSYAVDLLCIRAIELHSPLVYNPVKCGDCCKDTEKTIPAKHTASEATTVKRAVSTTSEATTVKRAASTTSEATMVKRAASTTSEPFDVLSCFIGFLHLLSDHHKITESSKRLWMKSNYDWKWSSYPVDTPVLTDSYNPFFNVINEDESAEWLNISNLAKSTTHLMESYGITDGVRTHNKTHNSSALLLKPLFMPISMTLPKHSSNFLKGGVFMLCISFTFVLLLSQMLKSLMDQ